MKLYYYQFRKGISNFGDNLNPWLWDRLLPNQFDHDKSTVFVGIGTLLNTGLPQAQKTVVFSSGVGYGRGLPKVEPTWKIYCVRGPLSAQALGIESNLAVADGALLIGRVYKPIAQKKRSFAYMPHIDYAIRGQEMWKTICEQADMGYIDPRGSTEDVLTAISETEVLLTEAMHGAIAAEALRIPWIPIRTSTTIFPFKWHDWCRSIGVQYQPHYVMPDAKLYPPGPGVRSCLNHWLNYTKQAPLLSVKGFLTATLETMAVRLSSIARRAKPVLAQPNQIERLTIELETRLEQFKQDAAAGAFQIH
jgi:succinoglycan biosynthesis protein ExoV